MDNIPKKCFPISELAVVVVAKNHNPTILNPDFLKYNKIVPSDWELASNPICFEPIAQVVFKNGITIRAELEKLIFSEDVKGKKESEIEIPKIAHDYVQQLPHVNYTAVGINPIGYVPINNAHDTSNFIMKRLIADGPWKIFEHTTAKASVKFIYTLADGTCHLDIEEGSLKEKKIPIIIFRANFHHDIQGSGNEEKLRNLSFIMDNWKKDLEIYKKIVLENFLVKGES